MEEKTNTIENTKPNTNDSGAKNNDKRRGKRTRRVRRPRVRSEYENKILGIRRVTRVVAGGRRFSFSVTMVVGNGKGEVGIGLGKAADTALAIEKATNNAKKNMITVPLTADFSIPHEVEVKQNAAHILLIPTPGKGFKAGSAVRTVLELAGVKHVSAKILSRSKNPLNNSRATITALQSLKPIESKMKKKDPSTKKHVTQKKGEHAGTEKSRKPADTKKTTKPNTIEKKS